MTQDLIGSISASTVEYLCGCQAVVTLISLFVGMRLCFCVLWHSHTLMEAGLFVILTDRAQSVWQLLYNRVEGVTAAIKPILSCELSFQNSDANYCQGADLPVYR